MTLYLREVKVKDQHIRRHGASAGTDRSLRHKAVALASILAAIALVVGSLFGDRGMLQLMEVREVAAELQREIETLESQNASLVEEILELRDSPEPIERLAREELGLAAPDETVFILRPPDP
jgi:cell division protein FtsB